MATAGSNAGNEANNSTSSSSSNVPQWKRDLIQRRRQQSKVLANNGASVKLCTAMIGTSSSVTSGNATAPDGIAEQNSTTVQEHHAIAGAVRAARLMSENNTACCGAGGGSGALLSSPSTPVAAVAAVASYPARRPPTGGATTTAAADLIASPSSVAYNMRLEADLSLCSEDAEDVVNGGAPAVKQHFAEHVMSEQRKLPEYVGEEKDEEATAALPRTADGKPPPPPRTARMNESNETNNESSSLSAPTPQQREDRAAAVQLTGGKRERVSSHGGNVRKEPTQPSSKGTSSRVVTTSSRASSCEDAESDSSEELQYGPGIVNKLRCKYLNLTLRETNKSRASVRRFRRAASLEDLLDRDDDEAAATGREKTIASGNNGRKYAKRSGGGGGVVVVAATATRTDRYRNASRGNDSMKRARSVETLMRYNSVATPDAEVAIFRHHQVSAPVAARPVTNGVRQQEPVNDHIILVDRTSIKIESRLSELDRPKPINKPKRIKPVLAETERPPPDLVKTTMRIFESSARKLKPKGEVAAKVATFKTINDTFKAQTQKKLPLQKPPLQPKPLVNGGARVGSPRKVLLHKPTAELIETQPGKEEYHVDGVVTEPIVQSVSSVVSKFQQIEKSHSSSPSPEPTSHKLKFSPANSPEPPAQICKTSTKSAVALEIAVKSPPVTPVLSPRILSPRLSSPQSPVKDARQGAQSPSSPVKDPIRVQIPSPRHKPPLSLSPVKGESCSNKAAEPEQETKKGTLRLHLEREPPRTSVESPRQAHRHLPESSANVDESSHVAFNDGEKSVDEEIVDGPRTISKTALDNIGKAGTTMQFNFGDESTGDKTYLPGVKQNGQKLADEPMPEEEEEEEEEDRCVVKAECGSKMGASVLIAKASSRLRERLEPEEEGDSKDVEEKLIVPECKPIGAICSLGLIKTATTTVTATISSSATYSQSNNEAKTIRCQQKSEFSPPQKQIGIIRPLVSTKIQHPQQNLSNRELEKNLINRVKSIEQPTKVVVSLKSADEIQPAKKTNAGGGGGGGGGLWDTKPWNQQNNTMVFNFSNRKDVPDYIENDGLIIRRKREKPKVSDGGIIVLDATLDASTTDDAEWEISGGPPSPCDVSFLNDNVLINGRSNLSRTPRNHKHRIQFDDTATRTFEYPSESSILEGETSSVDGETSSSVTEQQSTLSNNKISSTSMPSLLGGGGLASYTPSKVDLSSEGFELGITRAILMVPTPAAAAATTTTTTTGQTENASEVDYLRPAQDAGAWGSETTGDLLY